MNTTGHFCHGNRNYISKNLDNCDLSTSKNVEARYLLGSSDTDTMTFNGISGYFADKLEYDIKSCKKKRGR